jgi:hypothetical protein
VSRGSESGAIKGFRGLQIAAERPFQSARQLIVGRRQGIAPAAQLGIFANLMIEE